MADDKHYVPGDFYRIDDRTGFKVRAKRTKKQWDNMIVRDQSWEPRQPQDFVKGVRDDQNVPEPRPRQTNTFIGPLTSVVQATSPIASVTVVITTTARMYAGDEVSIMLNNGIAFLTSIDFVDPDGVTLIVSDPLPWSTSSGLVFTNYTALSPANLDWPEQ